MQMTLVMSIPILVFTLAYHIMTNSIPMLGSLSGVALLMIVGSFFIKKE